jgi:hypothetical protein
VFLLDVEAMRIIMYTLPIYIIWGDQTMFVGRVEVAAYV